MTLSGKYERKCRRLTARPDTANRKRMTALPDRRRVLATLAVAATWPVGSRAEVVHLKGALRVDALHSRFLSETRQLTAYFPPGWTAGERYPVLYMADGQFLGPYLEDLDALIAAGALRPLVVVGLWSGDAGPQSRPQEYVEGYPDGARRFETFRRFFLEEVMPKAEAEYGASPLRQERMLAGWSDGGAWAASTGLSEPSRFGRVCALSISSPNGTGRAAYKQRPALFLASGDDEPYYRDVTRDLAVRARRSPVELIYKTVPGRHEPAVWRPMLKEAALWAFGVKKEGSDGL